MFLTLDRLSWLETTSLLAKHSGTEIDEPCDVSQDVKLGRLENQESGITMGAGIATVTGIETRKLS